MHIGAGRENAHGDANPVSVEWREWAQHRPQPVALGGSRRDRFKGKKTTGTGHCTVGIGVFIPLNTHRHTAVFEGAGVCC